MNELVKIADGLDQTVSIDLLLKGLCRDERTVLLIDNNNIFRAAKQMSFRIDFKALWRIFADRCNLRSATIFTAISPMDKEAMNWRACVLDIGFRVVSKPLVRRRESVADRFELHGNLDVEMATAALTLSPDIEHVIIASRDGDFIPVVRELQRDGRKKVSVIGSSGRDMGMSTELRELADHFYDLALLKPFITIPKKRRDT